MKDHPLKGRKWTEEHKKKISNALMGVPFAEGRVAWNKGKKMPYYSGEKHWNWKGGTTQLRDKINKSLEYKLWRRAVYERDNYTCIWCGDNRGHNLNADHIKSFADYPELRFAIDNGRTLCEPCHRKTPSYLNSLGRNQYTKNNGLAR